MSLSAYGILRTMQLLIKKRNAVASTPMRTYCRSGGNPPGMRRRPPNEPPLKEKYDRNLNEVDGVDVFSECRLNAPSRTWLFLLVDHFSADP
jgi:hypothetical protein